MPNFLKRFLKYYYLRLVRQTGTPDFIARGVAIGLFIGMFIPFGGQFLIALGLAFLLKAHKITSIGCTWITNPWTIGFIYPFQCFLGSHFTAEPIKWSDSFKVFGDFIKDISSTEGMTFWENIENAFTSLMNLGTEILIPFFLGGLVLGVILSFIGYFVAYGIITHHRMKVDMRIKRKLAIKSHKYQEESEKGKPDDKEA